MESSTGEKILACIAADASAPAVMNEAARMARAFDAGWIALYVETPDLARLPLSSRARVLALLHECTELGAETYTLGSIDIAQTIIEFAKARSVTRIVVGAPSRARWLRRIAGSMVDTLVSARGGMMVEIVGAGSAVPESTQRTTSALRPWSLHRDRRPNWPRYLIAGCFVLLATAIGFASQAFLPNASLVTLYLLAALLSGLYLGQGPAVLAALGGSLSFNLLFTEPQFTLHIYQISDIVNFAALLTTGLVVAQLSARARHQARVAVQREERAVSLGAFTGALLSAQGEREIAQVACEHIGRAFDAYTDLWLVSETDEIRCVSSRRLNDADPHIIRQTLSGATSRSGGVQSRPRAPLHYVAVSGAERPIGALVMRPQVWKRLLRPEPLNALQGYARQLALALERIHLLQQKRIAELAMRAEDLRNDLLAGLSHDLRTPLASILGSASALAENPGELSAASQRDLIATIHEESLRMTRLVANLLDMARLTEGFAKLKLEWIPVEELIGSVRHRLTPLLQDRPISVVLSPGLPLAFVDGLLFEQVLQNLLENAVKYSPAGAPIEIFAEEQPSNMGDQLRITVSDRGIGVPEESRALIFEKFHRAHGESAQSGIGLGLALCKSIAFLHGGSVGMQPRVGGGSAFWVSIPAPPQPSFAEQVATS